MLTAAAPYFDDWGGFFVTFIRGGRSFFFFVDDFSDGFQILVPAHVTKTELQGICMLTNMCMT